MTLEVLNKKVVAKLYSRVAPMTMKQAAQVLAWINWEALRAPAQNDDRNQARQASR